MQSRGELSNPRARRIKIGCVKSANWNLPFVRWADTVRVAPGGRGAFERQLYDHELVYVLEGRGSLVLDGQKHELRADSLFLVRPRVFHSFLAAQNQAQRLLGVHFDWDDSGAAQFPKFRPALAPFEADLWREPREIEGWELGARPVLDLGSRPRVRRALEAIVAEIARGERESPRIAGALLAACIGQIEREARLFGEQNSHCVGADAVRRVQRAREWLETSETALSVEEIAARVGWSGDHLRRMMRAVTGEAPAQLQMAARMRRARELLRYGALPISEIARKCGFEDASHFARVFKRENGVSPRQWAALSRQNRLES